VRCVLLNMLNRESLRPLSSLSPHNWMKEEKREIQSLCQCTF
jgi:hypothetical protein